MTYNPPSYQPPPGPPGYSPQPGYVDPLAPARRAAVMCWVLGGLGVLCGLCLNGVAFLAPPEAMVQELRARLSPEQLQQLGNMDLATVVRVTYAVIGVVALLVSLVLLIVGGFVRRGGRGAVIMGLVIFIGLALVCAFGVLAGLIQAATVSPTALVAVVIWLAIGTAVGATIYWLSQALRASGAAAQQLQAYYWHLQQQQQVLQPPQGYGYGYGYGAPPSPQTPAAPPPQQSLGPMPPPPGTPNPGPSAGERKDPE